MATTDKTTGAEDKSNQPTTSTSAADASTTEGAKAAGVSAPAATPSSAGGAATAVQEAGTVRVELAQPEPAPEVHYPGDASDATNPDRPHVKADYKPFEW